MIRTLRITSIIAAIGATVLLVCAAVYGVRSDPEIEELLQAPNALDRFTASKGQSRPALGGEGQVSPLVKQAADFAGYLNPPPPSAPPPPPTEAAASEPAPPAPVSAKFDLVGTSYYASHPELSLALIDEPGKGLHWVRQGESISHLTVEKVSGGSITVRDGQKTSEMTVKVDEQWRNLVKGAASEAKTPAPAGPAPAPRPAMGGMPPGKAPTSGSAVSSPPKGRGPDIAALRRGPKGPATARRGPDANAQPATRDERRETRDDKSAVRSPRGEAAGPADKTSGPATAPAFPTSARGLIETGAETSTPGVENAAADVPPPPPPTEKDIIHQRLMDEVRASRITPDEAVRMEQLAETLEQLEELQKQKSAQPQQDANTPPDANQ